MQCSKNIVMDNVQVNLGIILGIKESSDHIKGMFVSHIFQDPRELLQLTRYLHSKVKTQKSSRSREV